MTHTTLDLDRAVNAFDQRAMPTALARLNIFLGLAFVAIGALPPTTPAYILIGFGALLTGLALLLPFWFPRRRWIAWLGGSAALLIGGLFICEAVIAVTPFARLSLPFPVDNALSNAIAIANQSYGGPQWFIARTLGALPSFLFGCELLVAAFLLFRLSEYERSLLAQRSNRWLSSVLECLFDISPGFVQYSRGYRFWMSSWLLALFPFTIALTNIVGARSFENLIAITRLVDCIAAESELPSCFEEYAHTHTVGMFIMTVVSIPLLIGVGTLLTNRLRNRLAKHSNAQRDSDKLPESFAESNSNPILFLRSADDDNVVLPHPAWTPMRYALAPGMRLTPDLDSLMIGELTEYGMPLALSAKEKASFGAHRVLVSEADEIKGGLEKWKRKVVDFATRAREILIVLDETVDPEWSTKREGLRWELELLAGDPELLRKTTIIVKTRDEPRTMPGKEAMLTANRTLWNVVRSISDGKIDPPSTNKPLMSLSYSKDMSMRATTASRMTSTTARLILRSVFRFT